MPPLVPPQGPLLGNDNPKKQPESKLELFSNYLDLGNEYIAMNINKYPETLGINTENIPEMPLNLYLSLLISQANLMRTYSVLVDLQQLVNVLGNGLNECCSMSSQTNFENIGELMSMLENDVDFKQMIENHLLPDNLKQEIKLILLIRQRYVQEMLTFLANGLKYEEMHNALMRESEILTEYLEFLT